jgi:hypothetical protein
MSSSPWRPSPTRWRARTAGILVHPEPAAGKVRGVIGGRQLGHRLLRRLEVLAEYPREVLRDSPRVAGLTLAHRPQAIRRLNDRPGAIEQVDMQLLALGQPVAPLAH